jgi:hypothetical protein
VRPTQYLNILTDKSSEIRWDFRLAFVMLFYRQGAAIAAGAHGYEQQGGRRGLASVQCLGLYGAILSFWCADLGRPQTFAAAQSPGPAYPRRE